MFHLAGWRLAMNLALYVVFENRVSAKSFATVVNSYLSDVVGAGYFANAVHNASIAQEVLDGRALIRKMEQEISNKLSLSEAAVKELRRVMQIGAAESTTVVTRDCCLRKEDDDEKPEFVYNEKFNEHVEFSEACLAGNSGKQINLLTDRMLNVAATNQDLSVIRSQRYVDGNGTMIQYPAILAEEFCDVQDFTQIAWYVSAAISGPKDIVLVLDAALLNDYIDETLQALVKLISKTISTADNIGVVIFSDKVQDASASGGPFECGARKLVPGNGHNLENLWKWMKKEKWNSGNANYTKAFQAAFDYFDSAYNSSGYVDRRKIMLFSTKTPPDDVKKDIFSTLAQRNGNLNNSVVIMTFDVTSNSRTAVLVSIASQNGQDYGVPQSDGITEGQYIRIEDVTNFGTELSSYYRHILPTHPDATQWSWARYDDTAQKEMVVTASEPVIVNDVMKGAVSVDVSVARLIEDTTNNLPRDDDVYAFVMDGNFKVISHPFLNQPSDYYPEIPTVDIHSLERSDGLDDLLTRIIEGRGNSSGEQSSVRVSMKTTWRDKSDNAQSQVVLQDSEVSCKSTLHSLFIVCVVVRENSPSEFAIHGQRIPEDFTFVYHRLDLITPESSCSHFEINSFLGTTVQLSSDAFVDSTKYMETTEDEDKIKEYKNDIMSESGTVIKDQARQDIFLTFALESLWKKTDDEMRDSDLGKKTLWKYVATKNGVLRIWPAAQLPKAYDHRNRPWYTTALKNRNAKFALAHPFMDVVTGKWVVSISRAVTLPTISGTEAYAVIGFDVFIENIEEFLAGVDERCDVFCELVLSSGFMIYHPVMLTDNKDFKNHLTEFEPSVASHLVEENILTKESCFDHEQRLIYQYYMFNKNRLPTRGLSYTIEQEEGTNVFLLYTGNRYIWDYWESCNVEIRTECRSETTCQTPCLNFTDSTCDLKSPSLMNQIPPCIPSNARSYKDFSNKNEDLEECYSHSNSWVFDLMWLRLLDSSWVLWIIPGIIGGILYWVKAKNRSRQNANNVMGTNGMTMGMTAIEGQNQMGQEMDAQPQNFGQFPLQQPPPEPGMQSTNQWGNQATQSSPGYGFDFDQPVPPASLTLHGFSSQPPSHPPPAYNSNGFNSTSFV